MNSRGHGGQGMGAQVTGYPGSFLSLQSLYHKVVDVLCFYVVKKNF